MGILGGTLSQLGGGFADLGNIVSGFAAGGPVGAAIAGVGEIVKGMQFAVSEAATMEQAWKNLQVATAKTGVAWETVRGTFEATALTLREKTVFSQEQVVNGLQRLMTYGMSAADAEKAIATAADFAAARHIDLEQATTLLGKAFDGNTSVLKRYGVEIQTSAKQADELKATFTLLSEKLKSVGTVDLEKLTAAMGAAGLSFQDAHGKMLPVKDLMAELEAAYKTGTIDAAQLSTIVGTMGVKFEASKLPASDFAGVLAQVNKQYGGEAQATAETYTGIQERLKNATADLGEKVGKILLPALSSLAEGMIPVVDQFGKGVDAMQAWFTQVGKMPEVQSATKALQDAFAGLQPFFAALWDALKTELMPVLQDLWSSLKDLWDALQPLGEALGEIISAFGGAGGEGIKLRDVIGLLVEPIKIIATVIRDVAPYIKLLGQAIKECADIIGPPLRAMITDIGEFLTWLHDSFDAFYKWLVGGSLWQDLWDGVVDVVKGVGPALLVIVQGIFTLIGGAFTLGMGLISGILTTGFTLTFGAIQTIISTGVSIMTGIFQPFANLLDTSKKTWSDLLASITTNTDLIKAKMNEIIAKVKDVAQQMIISWTATMEAMQNLTASAFDAMVAKISEDVDAIIKKLEDARNTITTHSIWPEMLSEMVQQSEAAMADMNAAFASGLTGPRGVVTMMGNASIPAPQAQAGPTYLSAEVPISNQISIDGEQISTVINRNTIRQRQLQRAAFA
jgi:hypothetical protein